jgi:hypothetical protein
MTEQEDNLNVTDITDIEELEQKIATEDAEMIVP